MTTTVKSLRPPQRRTSGGLPNGRAASKTLKVDRTSSPSTSAKSRSQKAASVRSSRLKPGREVSSRVATQKTSSRAHRSKHTVSPKAKMSTTARRHEQSRRRLFILLIGLVILFGLIVIQVAKLQVFDTGHY